MSERVACVVLAAGGSRRLGRPKQLEPYRGRPLIRVAAEAACQSRARVNAVVLGAHASRVRSVLADLPLIALPNLDWQEGIAASIRVAVAWAEQQGCSGLLLTLCDQPRLTAAHLNQLIAQFERSPLPVASRYAGKNAVPALFPHADFRALAKLTGDAGASRLLNDGSPIVSVPWPEGELDVDTNESALRWLLSN